MISCDFKPSDVNLLGSFPPFVATFDKTECECAAFYLVHALALGGDTWRAISWPEIGAVIRADIAACDPPSPDSPKPTSLQELVRDLSNNPFARPDFFKLVDKGYARWLGEPGGTTPLELTAEGLERLRRWVRKPEAA